MRLADCTCAVTAAGETGSSRKASDFFLGCAPFDSRLRLRLSYLRYFLVVLSSSTQISLQYFKPGSISVAASSKTQNIFSLCDTGIFGSNPIRGMDVCLGVFSISVALCRCSSCERLNPVQGVLPTLYQLCKLKFYYYLLNSEKAQPERLIHQDRRRIYA
jgi:hypothetical protein